MYETSSNHLEESLSKAYELFNSQKWYEAHDVLEDIWNGLDGDERQIIQGILQVSVSQFHLSKGNVNGAMILLGEGLGRIKTRQRINLGIDLASLCKNLEILLNKMHLDLPLSHSDIPYIQKL